MQSSPSLRKNNVRCHGPEGMQEVEALHGAISHRLHMCRTKVISGIRRGRERKWNGELKQISI